MSYFEFKWLGTREPGFLEFKELVQFKGAAGENFEVLHPPDMIFRRKMIILRAFNA